MTLISLLLASVLLSILLIPIMIGVVVCSIWFRWERLGRWQEARRHEHRFRMKIARWIWFRWIHLDCQYWIAFVNFNKGPITVVGSSPDALYWSFTYNRFMEVNDVVSSRNMVVDENGCYQLVLSYDQPRDEFNKNWLEVRRSVGRGVIYFRIYEPDSSYPTQLPSVTQDGRRIITGGLS